MPVIATVATAAIGAGTAIYSGSQQKKAADQNLQAQTAANDKSLAAQQAALDRVTQLESPFQQGGALGMSALLERLKLTHNGTPTGAAAPDPYYGYQSMTGVRPGQPPEYTDKAIALPVGVMLPPSQKGAPGSDGQNPPPGPVPTQPSAQGATDWNAYLAATGDDFGGGRPGTLSGGGATGQTGPALGSGAQGAPDWKAYLAANPDVAQWAQNHGDPNIPLDQQSPEQRAAYHWAHEQQVYGSAPRPLTYLPAANDPGQAPQGPATNPDGSPTDLLGASRPTPEAAPTFTRPDQGTAPDASQFFSNFTADPGYQFALDQGLRAENAKYGARGLLKSGSAMQGINDYAQGMANQQYGNWYSRQNDLYKTALNLFTTNRANANQNFENDRGYGTNLFLNQRDFTNNNFTNDRAYQTGRYDTATGNLFDLANMGQRAAGAVGGANQSYANDASNIFGAQANAQANAAQQRASANAGMFGSIAGAASNVFNTMPGMTTSLPAPVTVGNAYPTVTGINPAAPGPFTVTPASLPRVF